MFCVFSWAQIYSPRFCFYDCQFTWIRDVESCTLAIKCRPRQRLEPGKSLNLVNFHSRHPPTHPWPTTLPLLILFGNACREMNRSPCISTWSEQPPAICSPRANFTFLPAVRKLGRTVVMNIHAGEVPVNQSRRAEGGGLCLILLWKECALIQV